MEKTFGLRVYPNYKNACVVVFNECIMVLNIRNRMKKPYTVLVQTDEQGNIIRAVLNDNKLCVVNELSFTEMPFFIHERSALLRLTDINKTARGETIGRRLDPNNFTIYIDYEEFRKIKKRMLTGVNK